jgi:hypothetical protein
MAFAVPAFEFGDTVPKFIAVADSWGMHVFNIVMLPVNALQVAPQLVACVISVGAIMQNATIIRRRINIEAKADFIKYDLPLFIISNLIHD